MRITGLALGLALLFVLGIAAEPCPKCGDVCSCAGDILKAAKLISPGQPGRSNRPSGTTGPLIPIYGPPPSSSYGPGSGHGSGCRYGSGSNNPGSSAGVPYSISPSPDSNVYGVVSGYNGRSNPNRGCARSNPGGPIIPRTIPAPVSAPVTPSIVYLTPAPSSYEAPNSASSSSTSVATPNGAASSSTSAASSGPVNSGPYGSGTVPCAPVQQQPQQQQPGINYLPSIILPALASGAGYGQGPLNQPQIISPSPYSSSQPISYQPVVPNYGPYQQQSQSQTQYSSGPYGPQQSQQQSQSQQQYGPSPYSNPISVQPIIISSVPAPAPVPVAPQPVQSQPQVPICLTLGSGPNTPAASAASTSTSTTSVSQPTPYSPPQTTTSTSTSTAVNSGPAGPVGPIYLVPAPGPYQSGPSSQEPCNDGPYGPSSASSSSSSAAGPYGAAGSAGSSATGPYGSVNSGASSAAGPYGSNANAGSSVYDDDDEGMPVIGYTTVGLCGHPSNSCDC